VRKFLSIVSILFVALPVGLAQSSMGRILGTVTDASGAVIRGARVRITNTATGVARNLTTTDAGEYAAPNLQPGPYLVTVEASGFEKFQRTELVLEVARDLRVNAQLKPGSVSQTVTVTTQASTIDTTNDVLGSTFSNRAINELPLQGRDFQNLAILQPGIQRTPGGGFLSINANGNRPEDNNFIVDGIDDNDAYYGTTVINAEGVSGTPATHLPIDAIQEFNVQTSPEADYSFKPGAIINVGIKSGTNQFHGSAYFFNRDAVTDARNFFNPVSQPASTLELHEFGGSAGGPIRKDKLFYFANYEGVRDTVGNPLAVNSPVTVSNGDPTTSIVDAIAECKSEGTCSAISLNMAKLYPANNGQNLQGPTFIDTDFNNQNREDNGIVKVNYAASERSSFFGTYFVGDSLQTEETPNVLNAEWLSQAQTRAQVAGISWIFAGSANFTNQLRVGYNRFWQANFSADHGVNPTTYGINTGVTNPTDFGLPAITVTGFNQLGGSDSPLYTTPNQTYIYSESASYLHGAHNFHFGGEVRTGMTNNRRDTGGKGVIDFDTSYDVNGNTVLSPLQNFVRGIANYGYVFVGDSHRVVSQTSFSAFLQDTWRPEKNFIVSWGLRYDLTLPIHEKHDLLGNFDPRVGLVQVGRQISQPYQTDYHELAPRLAFIWDVHGDGRTVVRAGGGVIYEIPHISVYIGQNGTAANGLSVIPTGAQGVTPGGGSIVATTYTYNADNVTNTNAALTKGWQSGGPVFGNLSTSLIACSYGNPCPIMGVNQGIVTPYIFNWNLNVEQALWKNAAGTIAYVANKGVQLYSIRDINQNIYANDTLDDGQSGRPYVNKFPYLGFIDQLGNGDNSIYHALQLTLKQQTAHGLFLVAGYTWAHAIDDSSGNREFLIQNSYDPAAERGNADQDIRNRFTLAATYPLPGKRGHWQLLNGWQVNNIFTAQDGEPLLFADFDDNISGTSEYNDRWNITGDPRLIQWSVTKPLPYFPDGSVVPACVQATNGSATSINQLQQYGCFAGRGYTMTPPDPGAFGDMGRNAVPGPKYFDWDFSLIKTFQFGRINTEFRGEFFNVINHPNFAAVDSNLADDVDVSQPTVGQAFNTPDIAASNPVVGSGGSRHIQLGVKLRW
jgi:Carboxypeptidase regulatory-like domain